ncbi:MAG: hypothetical protein Tsb0020_46870 [Haliangiales bacterium]
MNRPRTHDGWAIWTVIQDIGGQLRGLGFGVAGIDMGAALAIGRARGAPEALLSDVLAEVEPVIVNAVAARMEEARDG